MERATLARPYAEAVAKLATSGHAWGAWSEHLALLTHVMADAQMQSLVGNPAIDGKRVADLIISVCGSALTAEAGNLVQVLADNKRLALIDEISAQFEMIKAQQEGELTAHITSAFPLSAEQLASFGVLMQLNSSEISELIKSRIQNMESGSELRTQGTVVSVTDGIVRVHGLAEVMQGEMLEFPGNVFGMALNLERDSVGAVVLGEYEHISEGDTVKCTGRILEVPVGEALLGRVVNALGQPIDGKGPVDCPKT
jgi:ATP synthase F1 delta subunit